MVRDLAAQVAELAGRLGRLEAEQAVNLALQRYAHAIDYGDRETWLDCFIPDGVFDVRVRADRSEQEAVPESGPPRVKGNRYVGREQLAGFVADQTCAPAVWHKHILAAPVMAFAADRRRVSLSSYFFVLDEPLGQPVVRAFGRYLDEMALGEDGRWRFVERIAEIESRR
jgi:hypothetical protein